MAVIFSHLIIWVAFVQAIHYLSFLNLMFMNPMRKWWMLTVVFAFISVISFFQIDSAWADEHNFNGFFGWLGIGIVTGLVAIYSLTKVAKYGGGSQE